MREEGKEGRKVWGKEGGVSRLQNGGMEEKKSRDVRSLDLRDMSPVRLRR